MVVEQVQMMAMVQVQLRAMVEMAVMLQMVMAVMVALVQLVAQQIKYEINLARLTGGEVKNARRSEVIERIRIMAYTERVAFERPSNYNCQEWSC